LLLISKTLEFGLFENELVSILILRLFYKDGAELMDFYETNTHNHHIQNKRVSLDLTRKKSSPSMETNYLQSIIVFDMFTDF
jgi:hypothetical protein